MEESCAVPLSLNKENTCPPGQTQEKKSIVVGSTKKKFPKGKCYELMLMEIVDKNNAHLPPKGGIGKYWTKVIADFNATTGPSVDKLSDWRPLQRSILVFGPMLTSFRNLLQRGLQTKMTPVKQ